jgi:uncharacterized membrane-anchored protein YitT (DUF2179 family)
MKTSIKEFILINIGLLLVAAGVYFFLVPNDLAAGGVTGLSMVINSIVPQIPVGGLMLIMNVVLFIIGFIFIGSGFGVKTIYSSLALSGMVMAFEKLVPLKGPLTGDIFLELIFGILVSGAGMGVVFLNNASTGGTDIIAKILNKYFNINIGKGVLMADFFITLAAAFTFGNVGRNSLYGPGLQTLDLAVVRDFSITETMKFQFRGEFFNALNRTNLGTPDRFVNTPQFGTITQSTTPGREIQLSARLSF